MSGGSSVKYGKFISAVYIINIITQGLFTLAFPMVLGFAVAWMLVEKAGSPTFLYPLLIVIGAVIGIISMISFILNTMVVIERLENQHKEKNKSNKTTEFKDNQ